MKEQFLNKLKRVPKPIIASIIYIFVVFFQNGITLITTPIFSRLLSTSEYGVTTTYQSWYNVIGIFVTLNLYAGVYNNALIDFDNEREKVTSSFLSISMALSFVFLGFFYIFKKQIFEFLELPELLFYYMFLNFLSYPAWGLFLAQQKFDYKYTKPLIITLITFILSPILGIIGIKSFTYDKAVAKVIFFGIPTLISNFVLLVYILAKGKCLYNKKYWKYALTFNIPLIPHYLSNVILAQSDRIMIQKMIGFSAAGIYSVAYSLSQVLQGIYMGINSAWIPFTYKSLKMKDYLNIKKNSNYVVTFILLISIVLIFFAPEIIRLLATSDYYEAVWVIPPIVLGLFFSFITSLFSNIEFYYKKNVFVTIGTSIAAISNIALNSIFIKKYGFIAAGYTTAIGYFVLMILHYLFMKKIKTNTIYDSRFFALSIMGIIVISIVIVLLYKSIMRYFILLIILSILIFNYKKLSIVIKKLINEIR